MVSLKKYDLKGKELETVEVDDALIKVEANTQMIKDYLVAMRNNKRQWSAKTKDRSEVKCTTKKPHAQKGSGNARQGSFVSPQYRGGGVVFGPRPKFDMHVRINRKEKRKAIRSLISEKIKEGKLSLLKAEAIASPKTKLVNEFLSSTKMKNSRTLFLGESTIDGKEKENEYMNLMKSMRNIPKVSFKRALNLNGYDLAVNQNIVILDEALKELLNIFEGEA